MAANKSDLIGEAQEEVNEDEARKYAQDIGATFHVISALTGAGIDLLFKSIGNKMLDSNYIEKFNKQSHSYKNNDNLDDEELNDNNKISSKSKKEYLYLNDLNPQKKNKKCC